MKKALDATGSKILERTDMSLVVVGSVAFDSIETPNGALENALGGSAVHFSMAASYFGEVRLVGVVGEDFPDSHRQLLSSRGICS